MTAPYIIRLMQYASLSRGVRLGPEDRMAAQFANELRTLSLDGKLKAVWFHPANELANGHKTGLSGAIARALGMHKGVSDYIFLSRDRCGALEAKSLTGPQSPPQKDFETWCNAQGVPYRVFRSVAGGMAILREWEMIDE